MENQESLLRDRWTQLAVAVTTLIAAVDAALPFTVLITFLVTGPLLASVRSTPGRSAIVGVYAFLLAIILGSPDRIFGSLNHVILCGAVVAGALLAVWAARVRVVSDQRALQSEERLRELVENSADGMLLLDGEGVIRYTSQSTTRLLGYSAAELLGKKAVEGMHPDDRKQMENLLAECLMTPGLPVEAQYRFQRKDGSWRHIQGVAVNRLDEPANPAIVFNYRDMTASTRSEEQQREYARLLQEAQQFNEEVISGAGEGIIVYNRALRYAVWNRFMEELTGLKAEKVLGQHPLELFPHLRSHGVYSLLERALAGETVRSLDVPFSVPSTGKSGWTSGTYSPHRNVAGEIVGVIGLVRDVAARKTVEGQLRASEDKYRSILDYAPIGIYEAKPEGTLLAANRALVKMLGYYSAEEMMTRGLAEIYADPDDFEAIVKRYEEGGLVRGIEVCWKRKDGTPLWVELHFHAKKDEQAWSRNMEGFVLDISDRKRNGAETPSVKEQLGRPHRGYYHVEFNV